MCAAVGATADDPIPSCDSLPPILKFGQPDFPTDVEIRGLPNPVLVTVEFILAKDGTVSDARVIEIDVSAHAQEFEARALRAISTTRFKPPAQKCRGKIKVAFKIVDRR